MGSEDAKRLGRIRSESFQIIRSASETTLCCAFIPPQMPRCIVETLALHNAKTRRRSRLTIERTLLYGVLLSVKTVRTSITRCRSRRGLVSAFYSFGPTSGTCRRASSLKHSFQSPSITSCRATAGSHSRHLVLPPHQGVNLPGSRGNRLANRTFGNPNHNITILSSPMPPPACFGAPARKAAT